jgi:hypothetical protein
MTTKERSYQTKAKRCEERAKTLRAVDKREWQLTLARAYRMLAIAEGDAASRRTDLAS